jgi:hypothetical protein
MKRCAIALAALLGWQASVSAGILQMTPCRHPPCVDCYSDCFGYYPTHWRPWPCGMGPEGEALAAPSPTKAADEVPAVMPLISSLPRHQPLQPSGAQASIFKPAPAELPHQAPPAAAVSKLPAPDRPQGQAAVVGLPPGTPLQRPTPPVPDSRPIPEHGQAPPSQGTAIILGPFPANSMHTTPATMPQTASAPESPPSQPSEGEAVIFGPFPAKSQDQVPSASSRTSPPGRGQPRVVQDRAIIFGPFPAKVAAATPAAIAKVSPWPEWVKAQPRPMGPISDNQPSVPRVDGSSDAGPAVPGPILPGY